tara:strand:+ start:50 stop:988 length:939 start_codon:yes stop_codon:yes gene_type:complete
MPQIILGTLIFCIVLFLYLHIFFHYKTSDDLEIYEIEQPSKDKLEEICDLRQPVILDFVNESLINTCNKNNIRDTYGAFDVKLRNTKKITQDEELYIPITFSNILDVLEKDTDEQYLSENNQDFLEETGLVKSYRYNDQFLRPHMVSNCMYDYIIGSYNVQTPFKFNLNYRNYYLVTEGNITIKLAPPKSKKYLYQNNDYENFEFSSPINPWNVQSQYKPDFDKIKCLETSLSKGQLIYIPAFWWYSIKFTSKETSIISFKYKTYMNNLAILPYTFMSVLQSQNIKRNIVEKIDLENNDIKDISLQESKKEN